MPSGSQLYTRKVMNKNGFVLFTPNVESMGELREATIDIWAESSTPQFPLGSKIYRGEQEFTYCYNGSVAGVAGQPIQSAAAAHAEQDDDIVVGAAAAIGAYEVELTSTANLDTSPNDSADDFAEGYLIVNDEAGEGHLYKIKGNEAFSGTANSTFTLYDPIKVALTVASQVGLIRNPFYKVIATTAVVTGVFIGVYPFAVTASYYFWAISGGPAPGIAQAAIAKGTLCVVGTSAAKFNAIAANSVDADGVTEIIAGEAITHGVADTESFIIYLYRK